MSTCPPSLSFSYQLPCDISSFPLFFFSWQNLSDSYNCFHRGRWLKREFLQLALKTKSNPKSPHLLCTNIFLSFLLFFSSSIFSHNNRRPVCLPVFVNHGNQASPFSHLVSLFQKRYLSRAKTSLLNPSSFEDKRRCVASVFLLHLSSGNFNTLHIVNEVRGSVRGE